MRSLQICDSKTEQHEKTTRRKRPNGTCGRLLNIHGFKEVPAFRGWAEEYGQICGYSQDIGRRNCLLKRLSFLEWERGNVQRNLHIETQI